MDKVLALLREMRGETSLPLIKQLEPILAQVIQAEKSMMAVQVESKLVTRGLTLIFEGGSPITSWIYFSRLEIPGFVPLHAQWGLQGKGWTISNDALGEEFAFAWKLLVGDDAQALAEDVCFALELLGAPQKHSWHLSPRTAF